MKLPSRMWTPAAGTREARACDSHKTPLLTWSLLVAQGSFLAPRGSRRAGSDVSAHWLQESG